MINYYTSANIYLHLEEYYNKGLTPKEIKKVIESLDNPTSNLKFYCRNSGINNNYIIAVNTFDRFHINEIVYMIDSKLQKLLIG